MKSGEKICVNTNYKLLNLVLCKNYKGYMSGIYCLSDKSYIWMVALDEKERQGWINRLYGDTIIEEYVGGKPFPNNLDTGLLRKIRYVFDKVQQNGEKYFIFRGVYELTNEHTLTKRVLRKIANEAEAFV